MGITITVPADTKTPGTAGHTSDHNLISDALTTLGAAAANTAGDTFTGTVNFADSSAISSSGYVGKDGITYGPVGRGIAFAAGQAVSSTSYVDLTGVTFTLGTGTYKFRFDVNMKANASAGQWLVILQSAATVSSINYGFRYTSAAGVSAYTGNITAVNTDLAGPATSVTGFYEVSVIGKIVTSSGGAFKMQGKTTVGADTWNIFAGSSLEILHVA